MGNRKERKRVQKLARKLKGIPLDNSGGVGHGTFDVKENNGDWAVEEKPARSSVLKQTGIRAWEKLESQAGMRKPALVAGDLVIISLNDWVDYIVKTSEKEAQPHDFWRET